MERKKHCVRHSQNDRTFTATCGTFSALSLMAKMLSPGGNCTIIKDLMQKRGTTPWYNFETAVKNQELNF